MPEFGDDMKISEVMNGIANGSIPRPNEQQSLQIAQQFQWQKAAWISQALSMGNQTPQPTKDNPHPRSRADYMGGAAAYNNLVEEQAKQFDDLGDLFAKGDVPLATAQKQFIEAANDDAACSTNSRQSLDTIMLQQVPRYLVLMLSSLQIGLPISLLIQM